MGAGVAEGEERAGPRVDPGVTVGVGGRAAVCHCNGGLERGGFGDGSNPNGKGPGDYPPAAGGSFPLQRLQLTERRVLVRPQIAWQAQHSLGDDVAEDFVCAAGYAQARRPEVAVLQFFEV